MMSAEDAQVPECPDPTEVNVPEIDDLKENVPVATVAGFWRRLAAFLLDGVVLSLPLYAFSALLPGWAFSLGPWGRLVGLGLMLAYWSYFHSAGGGGQTPDKRFMKIRVIDLEGNPLSWQRALGRGLILGLIVTFRGWTLPALQAPWLAFLMTIIVLGGPLAMAYGLLVNQATRAGLHDLIAGTLVVAAPLAPDAILPETGARPRQLTYGLLGLGVVLAAVGLAVRSGAGPAAAGDTRETLQKTLLESGDFFAVTVTRVTRTSQTDGQELRDLNVEVWAKRSCQLEPDYCEEMVKEIARTALDGYEPLAELTGMRVAIVNRFDSGIITSNRAQGAAWSIADWLVELEE